MTLRIIADTAAIMPDYQMPPTLMIIRRPIFISMPMMAGHLKSKFPLMSKVRDNTLAILP